LESENNNKETRKIFNNNNNNKIRNLCNISKYGNIVPFILKNNKEISLDDKDNVFEIYHRFAKTIKLPVSGQLDSCLIFENGPSFVHNIIDIHFDLNYHILCDNTIPVWDNPFKKRDVTFTSYHISHKVCVFPH